MIPMMVEILMETPNHEPVERIQNVVRSYVAKTTGKQTIYQMIRLVDEIKIRGGKPAPPLAYKDQYHQRLMNRIINRLEGLRKGDLQPEDFVVPGSLEALEEISNSGVKCFLASGTDEKFVFDEANLLGVSGYFEKIHGALDDYENFSKKMVIQKIIQDNNLHGPELVAFGDGYVEIENAKEVGGITIGMATNESERCGIDSWKRDRLIELGADVIMADFLPFSELWQYLNFGGIKMPYPTFDRSRLQLKPLTQRVHDLDHDIFLNVDDPIQELLSKDLDTLAHRIIQAKEANATVMMMIGAHVIRRGVNPFLIDLMQKGLISLISTNGACAIHDMEFAMIGQTTESVARYIQEGQFGLWEETGRVNEAAVFARENGFGLGEAIGKMIHENPAEFPYKETSLFAEGYRLGIPITVHVGIGQDIVHEHPNFDPAAVGETSYRDFLTLAHFVENLESGVMMNIGTAVMGPEVYLKALSMARNVAKQEKREIKHFTTAVFDKIDLGDNLQNEASKTDAVYYFRPYKTVLVRTVADGGESFYIMGDHRDTIPNLHHKIMNQLVRDEEKH